jgi:hypothetical protein
MAAITPLAIRAVSANVGKGATLAASRRLEHRQLGAENGQQTSAHVNSLAPRGKDCTRPVMAALHSGGGSGW